MRDENTRGVTGWCLEPHDLVAAKAMAGREQDVEFIDAALAADLVDVGVCTARARAVATEEARAERAIALIAGAAGRSG